MLLAAVLFWWLRPAAVTAPEPIAAAPESIATPAPPVTSPRPLVKLEPLPSAETKVEKAGAAETRAEHPCRAAGRCAARARSRRRPRRRRPPRPRSGTPTIQATPAPAPAPRPPASPETASLRLEALIYADAPAERMVFINGRRYREGDSIDGRLRIEEIREEGVELSDQGRRFTSSRRALTSA